MYNKKAVRNGILFVNDLVDDSGNFMDYGKFCEQHGQIFNFIEYGGMLTVVKNSLKACAIDPDNSNVQDEFKTSTLNLVCQNKKGCKTIYNSLISSNVKPASCTKWANEIILPNTFNWSKAFTRPFSVTKDSDLIWFQMRLLHNILASNTLLLKMKFVESDNCTFCNTERETLLHLFWDCPFSNRFWLELCQFLKDNGVLCHDVEASPELIVFGKNNVSNIINLMILLAKRYIYSSRLNKNRPHLSTFETVLKRYYTIDKRIAFNTDRQEAFTEKWQNFEGIL